MLVANGRWIVPLASWLAPIGWLIFLQRSRKSTGLPSALTLFVLLHFVAWRGIIPAPGILYFLIAGTYALVYFLPYFAHRLLCQRLAGFRVTLIFPTAWVASEFLFQNWVTPYGSWFSLAYTQTEHIALLQIAALTGHAGISFLMTWFAATIAWTIDSGQATRATLSTAAVFATALGGVLLYGQLRLSRPSAPAELVRAAGLVPSASLLDELEAALAPARRGGNLSPASRDRLERIANRLNDDLFSRSRREASAGAQLVTWSETAGRVLKAAEHEFVSKAQALATEAGVDLVLGYGVWDPDGVPPFENKVIAIGADGEVAWEYEKAHPIVGAESAFMRPGKRVIHGLVTPYGVVSAAICHDLDFPALLRQAHNAGTTLMVGPSADWEEITPLHANMAILRAIENGFSLIRPTSGGRSIATDWRGRTVAALDYPDDAFVAYLPTARVRTPYGAVGDLFSWLCVVGVIGFVALHLISARARSPDPRKRRYSF
ncbi:MAG: hypothetical protein JSU87_17135 [Gemmatimonadota bacterium]|nr:MAG: hypothetical protein JSU87_17135 [Gemmatimonadota bacterium]